MEAALLKAQPHHTVAAPEGERSALEIECERV
jgi:hypothetical protein